MISFFPQEPKVMSLFLGFSIRLSPFIEGKARTCYRLTNKNKTGYMDKSDFSEMADCFTLEFKLNEKACEEIRGWLVHG